MASQRLMSKLSLQQGEISTLKEHVRVHDAWQYCTSCTVIVPLQFCSYAVLRSRYWNSAGEHNGIHILRWKNSFSVESPFGLCKGISTRDKLCLFVISCEVWVEFTLEKFHFHWRHLSDFRAKSAKILEMFRGKLTRVLLFTILPALPICYSLIFMVGQS